MDRKVNGFLKRTGQWKLYCQFFIAFLSTAIFFLLLMLEMFTKTDFGLSIAFVLTGLSVSFALMFSHFYFIKCPRCNGDWLFQVMAKGKNQGKRPHEIEECVICGFRP